MSGQWRANHGSHWPCLSASCALTNAAPAVKACSRAHLKPDTVASCSLFAMTARADSSSGGMMVGSVFIGGCTPKKKGAARTGAEQRHELLHTVGLPFAAACSAC